MLKPKWMINSENRLKELWETEQINENDQFYINILNKIEKMETETLFKIANTYFEHFNQKYQISFYNWYRKTVIQELSYRGVKVMENRKPVTRHKIFMRDNYITFKSMPNVKIATFDTV